MTRRTALIILAVLILAGAATGIFVWHRSFQIITVRFVGNAPRNVKLYHANDDTESIPNEKDLIRTIVDNTSLRLHKGGYLLIAEGNDTYESYQTTFSNREGPITIEVNPDFTDDRLTKLSASEQPVIENLVKDNYPAVKQNYNIQGRLLDKADWFAGVLKPNDDTADTLRFVAHKVSDRWVIVTKPPSIVISKVDYPDIPETVIKAVNNL